MICVYPADCANFSTNGTLALLSAEVTETLNGEYKLTQMHPIDEVGRWQRLVEGCILRALVPADMSIMQGVQSIYFATTLPRGHH